MNANNFRRVAASAGRWSWRVLVVVACAALCATPGQATTDETNGHDLLARCRNAAQPGGCYNELLLVADMHDVVAAWGIDSAHWCMPDGLPPARLRELVLAWLTDPAREPNTLEAPSTRLVAAAYAAAFPCRDRE